MVMFTQHAQQGYVLQDKQAMQSATQLGSACYTPVPSDSDLLSLFWDAVYSK